ncbi:hypothetical protein VFPPC_12901 [Pochonia chlamydosporia 170]|uniref:Uncharacterized protein n=1 Tax=Pochonia chlamydosporia 170 TaxID=1380566 RepID=A0A179G6F7_METCM|nr:hypothetical protein VFPPC_12901 [Pochonia chlamydosporia 170]OAQ72981.1 hypothetical protein VFPPC_12901 [Pochonia chlamydosporia 170]
MPGKAQDAHQIPSTKKRHSIRIKGPAPAKRMQMHGRPQSLPQMNMNKPLVKGLTATEFLDKGDAALGTEVSISIEDVTLQDEASRTDESLYRRQANWKPFLA